MLSNLQTFKSEVQKDLTATPFKGRLSAICNGVTWLLDLQESGTANEVTINCGTFIPGLLNDYLKQDHASPPSIPTSCIHTSIGMLAPKQIDKWWSLDVPLTTLDRKELQSRLLNDSSAGDRRIVRKISTKLKWFLRVQMETGGIWVYNQHTLNE